MWNSVASVLFLCDACCLRERLRAFFQKLILVPHIQIFVFFLMLSLSFPEYSPLGVQSGCAGQGAPCLQELELRLIFGLG